MEKVLRYRAMGSLCRQNAVLNPSIVGSFSQTQSGGNILPQLKSLPASKNATPLAQVTPRSLADAPTRMTRDRRRLLPRKYSYASGLAASVALKTSWNTWRVVPHHQIYDTGNHRIFGVAQAQSADQTLTFTSQERLVRVKDLPKVAE